MASLFGGNSDALKLSQQEARAAQLRQLATLSRQQAETDQARSSGSSSLPGRRLLTFIGASNGSSTLG